MVRWSWINFQVWGVLLVWIRVGQGPTALAVGAGGGCLDVFALVCPFSFLSPSLWETTRYRLKYCLKGSLSPKTTNNQPLRTAKALWSFGHSECSRVKALKYCACSELECAYVQFGQGCAFKIYGCTCTFKEATAMLIFASLLCGVNF